MVEFYFALLVPLFQEIFLLQIHTKIWFILVYLIYVVYIHTQIQIPTPFSQLKNYCVILHYISAINFAIIRKSLVEVNYAIKNLAFLHTIIYLSCLYGYVYICNNMFCIYVCLSSCVLANCLAICFCSEMFLGLLHFLLTLPLDVDCLG